MRHSTILYPLSLILLFGLSCKQDVTQSSGKEDFNKGTLLAPLIKYRVMVEDTSYNYMFRKDSLFTKFEKTKDSSYLKTHLVTNLIYLPFKEFEDYKWSLYNVIRNENIFITDKDLNVSDRKELRRKIYFRCDSVKDLEHPNEPYIFMCDSISGIDRISALEFYEKWYYNKESGSITKEILAYSPLRFNDEHQKYDVAFYVFKNKEVFNELKSKIQNNKK